MLLLVPAQQAQARYGPVCNLALRAFIGVTIHEKSLVIVTPTLQVFLSAYIYNLQSCAVPSVHIGAHRQYGRVANSIEAINILFHH